MPTTRLVPGEVTPVRYDDPSTPTIVGASPQWADDSDATYARMVTTGDGTTSQAQTAWADMARLSANPQSVTELVWHARVAGNPADRAHEIALVTPDSVTITAAQWPVVVPATPMWISGTFYYDLYSTTPAEVAGHLAAGCKVWARSLAPLGYVGTYEFTLYEFHIDVTHAAMTQRAPLRVVQRGNDGLGLSGGRRVVQGRTVQAGNRVVGVR